MSSNVLIFFLLVFCLAIGWLLGRTSILNRPFRGGPVFGKAPSKDYFIGLNYLLNDEPDDAVDIFIDSLEVNSSTLETHMALGTLLRRRGKVDRSIAVYQDLLARPGLNRRELNEVKVNLVQSYIAAGLLDRAERLLEELKQEEGGIKVRALQQAANVFQLEKDWLEGVRALDELLKVCPPAARGSHQMRASHFYCELAQRELDKSRCAQARDFLKHALHMDKNNVRVSILMGDLESASGNEREAISNYLRVKKQDPRFLGEVFDKLVNCFRQSGKSRQLEKFMDECVAEESHASVLLGVADYLEQEQGKEAAKRFLIEQLNRKSSIRMLERTMTLALGHDAETKGETLVRDLAICQKVIREFLDNKAQYQCNNCGFELKSLHWLCPSCSNWGSVGHVVGSVGE